MKKPTPDQGLALLNLQRERQTNRNKVIPNTDIRNWNASDQIQSVRLSGALYGLNLRTAKGKQAERCLKQADQIRSSLPAVHLHTFDQALEKSLCL